MQKTNHFTKEILKCFIGRILLTNKGDFEQKNTQDVTIFFIKIYSFQLIFL